MIGSVSYVLVPKALQTTIFHNFGEAKVKIAVHNNSELAGVALSLATKPGSSASLPGSLGVPPKATVVFTTEETWLYLYASNSSHNEGSATISVSYE